MGILYDAIAGKAAEIAEELYHAGMSLDEAIWNAAKECNIRLGKKEEEVKQRNED